MFVPVIAYDPDFFADFTMVMAQMEIATDSQPQILRQDPLSTMTRTQVANTLALGLRVVALSKFERAIISEQVAVGMKPIVATQVQSKFTGRTFASSLPQPTEPVALVQGMFQTSVDLEPLYDNVVFRVTVGSLNLSNTQANNKPIAPMVG